MFDRFFEDVAAAGIKLHGAQITYRGVPVLKRCFDADIPYPVYSATKSVTSAAVLIAHSEDKLYITDKLYSYLDKRYADIVPEPFKSLSFRDFMTMSAAPYPFRPQEAVSLVEVADKNDWISNILRLPVDYTDRSFHYSNIPAYLVGAACENAVGMPLIDYLSPRLFEPLGWNKIPYQRSPEGHFYGATGMELTVSQLADFGQLFVQSGIWHGSTIIPSSLVNEAVRTQVKTEKGGYGYFFWTTDTTFAISGKWGQRFVASPEKQLSVTYLSHQPERSGELADIAQRFIDEFQEV
ncbi:serine hydrolase domain-containing protein [Ruminococcus albus]|uniref:serine hydrolase domain-containing protein n=1 Tax=Ruminococcus albus TaxID=1264 RepID=UPI000467702A|nr:serine hydrolase [Ruminococcus albus]